jgi:hypothetical protein
MNTYSFATHIDQGNSALAELLTGKPNNGMWKSMVLGAGQSQGETEYNFPRYSDKITGILENNGVSSAVTAALPLAVMLYEQNIFAEQNRDMLSDASIPNITDIRTLQDKPYVAESPSVQRHAELYKNGLQPLATQEIQNYTDDVLTPRRGQPGKPAIYDSSAIQQLAENIVLIYADAKAKDFPTQSINDDKVFELQSYIDTTIGNALLDQEKMKKSNLTTSSSLQR